MKKKLKEDLREFNWDSWQEKVLRHKGNIALRCGRQVGKSTVVSMKAFNLAIDYPGTNTMILGAVERQASLLFERTRAMFDNDDAIRLNKLRLQEKYKSANRRSRKGSS